MRTLLGLLSLLWLTACTSDSYDQGEGRYSQLVGDYAELTVNSQKRGVSFTTDEGVAYRLTSPVTASWMTKADSIYRTIIYYNKVGDGQAEVVSFGLMPTLHVLQPKNVKRQPEDPVGLESVWMTKNGKYLNLGLLLKNGRLDDGTEGIHSLALICDKVVTNADLTQTAYYRLLHDQGEAPTYYSNRKYFSILLPQVRPDSVRLTVNTFQGRDERCLSLKIN